MTSTENSCEKINILERLINSHPECISERFKVKNQIQIQKIKDAFNSGRKDKHPQPPKTATDDAVYQILESYFDYEKNELKKLVQAHKDAMAAENIVGELLERFLASILEPHGWLWCSGSVIKAVDFVKENEDGSWIFLQIKNRDNSENSSSKAIRDNTDIQKWFRSFSKKPVFNWEAFPLPPGQECLKVSLTEDNFRKFIKTYLKRIKK